MSVSILGLETAVPPHSMSQTEAAEMAKQILEADEYQSRVLHVLYRKAGVKSRHTCLPHRIALSWLPELQEAEQEFVSRDVEGLGDAPGAVTARAALGPTTDQRMRFYQEHAFPLARQAVAGALRESGLAPHEITHLVTVSCTGFSAPGVCVQLIQEFGLPATTQRVHVGFMGCHGALNGLRVCQGLSAAHRPANILLCAVELCSLHYRFQWDPERSIGNILFADGAAAMVLADRPDEDEGPWRLVATGSCLIPDSAEAMSWHVGNHGFDMYLSAAVPELIKVNLRGWLSDWLASHGLGIEDVGNWAIHPGGPRILTAVEESLGLPREALATSREVLSQNGNMSSPTVMFILEEFRRQGAKGSCVMLGFGPGLTAEAALLQR